MIVAVIIVSADADARGVLRQHRAVGRVDLPGASVVDPVAVAAGIEALPHVRSHEGVEELAGLKIQKLLMPFVEHVVLAGRDREHAGGEVHHRLVLVVRLLVREGDLQKTVVLLLHDHQRPGDQHRSVIADDAGFRGLLALALQFHGSFGLDSHRREGQLRKCLSGRIAEDPAVPLLLIENAVLSAELQFLSGVLHLSRLLRQSLCRRRDRSCSKQHRRCRKRRKHPFSHLSVLSPAAAFPRDVLFPSSIAFFRKYGRVFAGFGK